MIELPPVVVALSAGAIVGSVVLIARAERRLRKRVIRLRKRMDELEEALDGVDEELAARRREGREIASGRIAAAIAAVREQPAVAARARAALTSAGRAPTRDLYAACDRLGRDALAWRLVGEPLDGRYLEAGGGGGGRNGPTVWFEALGWLGVAIEADPDLAAALASARPRCTIVAKAVVGPGAAARVRFHRVEGGADHPGLPAAASLGFVEASARALAPVIAMGARTREIDVPSTTLAAAWRDAGDGRRPDVLVIDYVSGAADALAGLEGLPLPRVAIVAGAGEGPFPELASEDETLRVRETAVRIGYVAVGRHADALVLVASDAADVLERARADRAIRALASTGSPGPTARPGPEVP